MLDSNIRIINETIEKQLKTDMPREDIYKEALDFALTVMHNENSLQIHKECQRVYESVDNLTQMGEWNSLQNLATHILENCNSIIDEKYPNNRMFQTQKLRGEMVKFNKPDFLKILTPEAIEKYFPKKINK